MGEAKMSALGHNQVASYLLYSSRMKRFDSVQIFILADDHFTWQ